MKNILVNMQRLATQIRNALEKSGVPMNDSSEEIIYKALRKFFQV